jgi:hypothetical protein
MACEQEMTYGRSIPEDLRLAEEARMVFPEAVVETEVDELEVEVLNTVQLCKRGNRRWVWYLWATGARQRRGG